jgi:hypothetical protein
MRTNRPLGRMLVSREKNRTVDIDIAKVSTGSFYTTRSNWLTQEIRDFLEQAIQQSGGVVLDPFAGDGHLLEAIKSDKQLGKLVVQTEGFDIQGTTWPRNDSLIEIPNSRRAVIVTNPPYLANHSAKRKGVDSLVKKYFESSDQDNLFKVALVNSLAVADYVVAIIPETFLLSSFPKDRLELAVVIQDTLFGDTEAPALVACFGKKLSEDADIFVGHQKGATLNQILALRNPLVSKRRQIVFNDPAGRVGLRAVDGSDGESPIQFMLGKDFDYPRQSVVVSSRLMTYLDLPEVKDSDIPELIAAVNDGLNRIRKASLDLALAPFKGNDKKGKRRRRLDYALARSLLNQAAQKVIEG